ncbi:hypothetical protein [Mesorhizobium sp. IMUNJ 23232]|uniref:hypothetical protein n=1 Tax=Mesorhizobium sp. IMUNJ 23232 TaxID=3376064 RepID=UPI00378C544C
MSKAHLARTIVFLIFAVGGLWLFLTADVWWIGLALFLCAGLIGGLISEWLFRWLATPDEQRLDLEDRVRNSDI